MEVVKTINPKVGEIITVTNIEQNEEGMIELTVLRRDGQQPIRWITEDEFDHWGHWLFSMKNMGAFKPPTKFIFKIINDNMVPVPVDD